VLPLRKTEQCAPSRNATAGIGRHTSQHDMTSEKRARANLLVLRVLVLRFVYPTDTGIRLALAPSRNGTAGIGRHKSQRKYSTDIMKYVVMKNIINIIYVVMNDVIMNNMRLALTPSRNATAGIGRHMSQRSTSERLRFVPAQNEIRAGTHLSTSARLTPVSARARPALQARPMA
jgi:hypothetical protein